MPEGNRTLLAMRTSAFEWRYSRRLGGYFKAR